MLLGDLVQTSCDNSVTPPACTDDPQTSWVTSLQFYAGLGLVQVGTVAVFMGQTKLIAADSSRCRRKGLVKRLLT